MAFYVHRLKKEGQNENWWISSSALKRERIDTGTACQFSYANKFTYNWLLQEQGLRGCALLFYWSEPLEPKLF